jgi:hypothetical protein
MREDRKWHNLETKIALSKESSEMQVNWAKNIIRHVDWVTITGKSHSPRHPPVLPSCPSDGNLFSCISLLGEHFVLDYLYGYMNMLQFTCSILRTYKLGNTGGAILEHEQVAARDRFWIR